MGNAVVARKELHTYATNVTIVTLVMAKLKDWRNYAPFKIRF